MGSVDFISDDNKRARPWAGKAAEDQLVWYCTKPFVRYREAKRGMPFKNKTTMRTMTEVMIDPV